MGHYYELVLVIHPHQSDQLVNVLNPYLELIKRHKGAFYAFEDWGKRRLAYPINKMRKAHYVFLIFSSTPEVLLELSEVIRYDELILRKLLIRRKDHTYTPSPLFLENGHNPHALQRLLNLTLEANHESEPQIEDK